MTLFVLSTLVALCVALEAGMEYTESFLNGRVTLEWAIINNNTAIEMLVTGQATGWIGVGVSPQGGMQGADITLGWLDETTGAPVIDMSAALRARLSWIRSRMSSWFR
jgi:hypothetical protein